ncbi:MAG: DUF11 domain-containing protein, partial [Anaerolineae bacterium]|nr:DUF11 domain-containing protein [Anaerolineae bacterium]
MLIIGMLLWGGITASPVAASANPRLLINEIYRGGTLGATGNEWIELVLVQDLTAAELEGFYVGDSTSSTASKYSGYKFTNMNSIAATFPKGTIIVVGGGAAFTEDSAYDPASGDWNLLLYATGSHFTRNGYNGDLAATDVAYVDTNGAYGDATMSADGFAVHWGTTTGVFGALADVKVTAPANPGAMALDSDLVGALTPANWSAPASPTPGQPNGGANTAYVEDLRTGGGPGGALIVNKTGPDSVIAGSVFSYTLVVENQTGAQLTDLVVSDILPLSATFAYASPAGTWDAASHTITWTQMTLADTNALTYTIVVTAPETATILNNVEYAGWAANWITPTTGSAVQTQVETPPPAIYPIYDLQYTTIAGDGTYPSLYVDQTVTTTDTVCVHLSRGYIIADAPGPWHSLYIYNG